MKFKDNKQNALLALTSAAVALPGMQTTADVIPEKKTLSVRYTNYVEDETNPGTTDGDQASDRYTIDVTQIKFTTPVTSKIAMSFDFAQDKMSGATPWRIKPKGIVPLDAEGNFPDPKPEVVMSQATVEDTRNEFTIGSTYYIEEGTISAFVGMSTEDDYDSVSGGMEFGLNLNEQHTRVAMGLEVSADSIKPVQNVGVERPELKKKGSGGVFFSVNQVINRFTTLQVGVSVTNKTGYLSDPYKQVWIWNPEDEVTDDNVFDERPPDRTQMVFVTNLRRYSSALEAALHFDYRLYNDNWGVSSHTFGMKWFQNYENDWQFVPGLRIYTQSGARFYAPYFANGERSDGYHSSDYRLSSYGAVSLQAQVVKRFENWKINASAERYQASESLALDKDEYENPALVEFTRLAVGIDYTW